MGSALSSLICSIAEFKLFAIMDHAVSVRDFLFFIGTMGITLILVARLPGLIRRSLLKRLEKRFASEEELKGWGEEDRKKSMEYSTRIINSFATLLLWGIFFIGATLALIVANIDIYEPTNIHGLKISIMTVVRFFGILVLTLFFSRVVPIWLISILNNFITNLKSFRFREGRKPLSEEERKKRVEYTNQITEYFTKFLFWSILLIGVTYAIATLGFEPDTKLKFLGAEVTVINLMNSILSAVITAVFVIYFLPPILNLILKSILRVYAKHHETEAERVNRLRSEVEKIKPGLYRTLLYLIILIGAHTAISYLPEASFYSFLQLVDVIIKALIVLAATFLFTILTPIFIYTLSASRKDFRKSNIYQAGRYIQYLALLISLFIIMNVVGLNLETSMSVGESKITVWSIISAILVFVVTLMASRMIIAMLRDTVLHPDQIDRHASAVLERIIHVVTIAIGIAISLSILGVNILAVATGLGLIGFALAFGMQDTIANFMAGIMIAVERPFRIGDRIRVGDEWGDVVDIGMRSTRIRTVKNETVTIPNNLIATREVWNFTKESPSIIMTVPVGISYDSNWHHAEETILNVANRHPLILRKPEPHVRMISYGESSIDLELWAWLSHAKYMDIVSSDILKSVKDKFDKEGIEIPYPYRTIVFKKDINEMRMMGEFGKGLPPGQTRLF